MSELEQILAQSRAAEDFKHAVRGYSSRNPSAHIEVGAPEGVQAYDVTARELPQDERDQLFDKISAAAPGFAEYQAKTSRVIPLFELQRA